MKIFVVHVNTHQRMTSADEDFNNQMNSHSIYSRHSPSPETPVIAQYTHNQSNCGGRDGGYTWSPQHELQVIKANLATATAECPTCQ